MARAKGTDGKTVYGYGTTPEEAEADLAAKLSPAITTIWTPVPETRLRDFAVGVWRPTLDRLEEASIKRYTGSWRKFLDAQLGTVPLSELRRAKLDEWMRDLRAKKVPSPSIRYAASVLSNILNLAVDYELIDRNPVASLKLPRKTPKRDRRLTVEQAATLLEACKGTELAAPVFLSCVLGLRRGEIAGLKWEDLDRQRGELNIVRQRRASKGKGVIEKRLKTESSKRTLRLPKNLIAEIDARGNLDSPYVCTRAGKPWVPDTITEAWTQSRKAWGLPKWTFHDLRHGAAGLLYATGADLLEIAAVLGHAKPDMSWLYTSAGNERAATAISDLGAALKLVDKTAPKCQN